MRANWNSPSRHSLGGAMIGILIVVVIIIVLFFLGWGSPSQRDPSVPQAIAYIDRSKGVACDSNRGTIRMALTQFQINNPGMVPTIEILQKTQGFTSCPEGGLYHIGKDGTVYCTKHFPPPPSELVRMAPVATPTPTPGPSQLFQPAK